MKTIKQVLCPERVRTVPQQFSWVDQALVQHHLIDRCDSRSATLYLFLITVADHQGLSYYGASTLAARLHLSEAELAAARTQLMALDLIAWQAPLYQVLALPGTRTPVLRPSMPTVRTATAPAMPPRSAPLHASSLPATPGVRIHTGPISLAQLLTLERSHAQI
jgi:hypothetical protein